MRWQETRGTLDQVEHWDDNGHGGEAGVSDH